jgi:anaphase-promoting complex subunit 2
MESFAKTYEETKPSRKLCWLSEHGHVDLVIELAYKEPLEIRVSPLQATILMLFEGRHEWDLSTIIEAVGAPIEHVRNAVIFWSSHHVLHLCGGDVVVSLDSISKERLDELSKGNVPTMLVQINPTEQLFHEHMEATWPMIQGMLTNLGALPADMVHRTLQMFVSDAFQYTLAVTDLEQLLQHLVCIEKLDVEEGKYRIKRDL